ncbi:MAG: right-handed parallel beta-helix repeat-containing protein, partial [bacterium]
MKKSLDIVGILMVIGLVTFLFQGRGWATVTISGSIIDTDTTWTTANSPYLVTGNVFVKGTGTPTLTIEPNTKIRFAWNTSLYIGGSGVNDKGKLIADGRSAGTITFTSDQATHTAGYWGSIFFDNYSDDGSLLGNVVVEYGGGDHSSKSNIYCTDASPAIQNSIIGTSSAYGIGCNNSSPQITNDTIKNNSSHGIYLQGNSDPVITANIITNNNHGIYCAAVDSSPSITTNIFTNNKSYPVRIGANSIGKVHHNTYSGNNPDYIYVIGDTIDTSETWVNNGVTYVIGGNIFVKGTGTPALTIEPNTEIRFTRNTSLYIGGSGISDKGKLIADGIMGTITFTSDQATHTAGYWGSIFFDNYSDDSSLLRNVVIEYGGGEYSSNSNIYCNDASPAIQSSIIRNSFQYGIRCNNSFPVIDTNTFTLNNSYPVYVSASSFPALHNNTYLGNNTNAIYLEGRTITNSITWIKDGAPYIIGGNVFVKGTGTPALTIEPNTEIRFAWNTSLYIGGSGVNDRGKLIADGRSAGTITFTSDQATHTAGYWGSIFFDNYSDDGSLLRNVVIEYGGGEYFSKSNIYCNDASPAIQSSIIRNSFQYGIRCNNSFPVIDTNTFTLNNSYPVYVSASSSPALHNNTYSGNNTDAIYLEGRTITNSITWIKDGAPYVIGGNVFVKGTVTPTLTIAPNTEIRFARNTSLYIGGSGINDKGKLIADGSWGTITFTSDEATHTTGYWSSIFFDNYSDDESLLRNVVIEYGGGEYSSKSNIYCTDASPMIQNSIIGTSSAYGIRCNNSFPVIDTNTFTNNNSYPVYVSASSSPVLHNNTYLGNNTDAIYLEGRTISNSITWIKDRAPYVIGGNVFVKGTGTPILTIEPNTEIRFATNTSLCIGGTGVDDKGKLIADGSLGAITFTSDQATHTAGYWGSIFFDNYSDDKSLLRNVVVEYGGTYSANICCNDASPTIQNSIIGTSSMHGIYLQGNSKPFIGTTTITNNKSYGIYCNGISSQPILQNNTIAVDTIATNTTAMRITPNTDFSTNTITGNINAKIEILGGDLTSNKLWKNFNRSYVILGTVFVKGTDTPTLFIAPNTEIRFARNTGLY